MGNGFNTRKEKIMQALRQTPELKVPELVELTGAAIATIRRDLLKMESMNLIVRTFGSIRSVEEKSLVARTFEQRSFIHRTEKQSFCPYHQAYLLQTAVLLHQRS